MIGIVALWLIAGLDLDPQPRCPTAMAVQAVLRDLGVDLESRHARATWSLESQELALRIEVGPDGATIERRFPAGACAPMAEVVALAIERATAPWPRARTQPVATSSVGIEGTLGAVALLAADLGLGGEGRGTVWFGDGPFGLSALVGATLPTDHAQAPVNLSVSRVYGGLGASARLQWWWGSIGATVYALLDQTRGDPSGVLMPVQVRDLRFALRCEAWITAAIGALALRAAVGVHVMDGPREYRAIPGTLVLTMPIVQPVFSLSVGAVSALGWRQ